MTCAGHVSLSSVSPSLASHTTFACIPLDDSEGCFRRWMPYSQMNRQAKADVRTWWLLPVQVEIDALIAGGYYKNDMVGFQATTIDVE